MSEHDMIRVEILVGVSAAGWVAAGTDLPDTLVHASDVDIINSVLEEGFVTHTVVAYVPRYQPPVGVAVEGKVEA